MPKTIDMSEVPSEQNLAEYLEICLNDLKKFPAHSDVIKERIKNATKNLK